MVNMLHISLTDTIHISSIKYASTHFPTCALYQYKSKDTEKVRLSIPTNQKIDCLLDSDTSAASTMILCYIYKVFIAGKEPSQMTCWRQS